MPRVRLALCDLAADWDPQDNYFTRALRRGGYEIDFCQSPDDAPDFVIAGTFGHTALDYACCRIQYSGEDSWPDLNLYDYALGFPLLSYEGRYMRLPLYAMRDTWAPALEKHRADPAEVFARPGFCGCVVSNDFSPERNAMMDALDSRGLLGSGGGSATMSAGLSPTRQPSSAGTSSPLPMKTAATPATAPRRLQTPLRPAACPSIGATPASRMSSTLPPSSAPTTLPTKPRSSISLSNCPKMRRGFRRIARPRF